MDPTGKDRANGLQPDNALSVRRWKREPGPSGDGVIWVVPVSRGTAQD